MVTHDLAKFARLMRRRNGYVIEQVLSPLVVRSTREHEQLVALADGCITKWHAHHYRGFDGPSGELLADDVARLHGVLDEAVAVSKLPDRPSVEAGLHELAVWVGLGR
ncbi:DNA polymerase beta superfamily protein [Kribbella sp. WER1]